MNPPSMLAATMDINAILGQWRLDRLLPDITPTNRFCADGGNELYGVTLKCTAVMGERPRSGPCFDAYDLKVFLKPLWSADIQAAADEGFSIFGPGNPAEFWNWSLGLSRLGQPPDVPQALDETGYAAWTIKWPVRYVFRNVVILEPLAVPGAMEKYGLK